MAGVGDAKDPAPYLDLPHGRWDRGPATSRAYKEAVEALYALSYALKFEIKREEGMDYSVMPLESLWWIDGEGSLASLLENREAWQWTAMMMQPEWVTGERFERALAPVERKKNLSSLRRVRFEPFAEGRAAQITHVGPFAEEGPTIERLRLFIEERGGKERGRHHEIYLNDFNRTAPKNLKTVIRQPLDGSRVQSSEVMHEGPKR